MSQCIGGEKLGSSRVYHRPLGIENQGFSLCLLMTSRLPPAGIGVMSRGCFVSKGPRLQVRQYSFLFLVFFLSVVFIANPLFLVLCSKETPKLKSRYSERVEKAIEYALTIESWDDLVDLRTLAFYNLGPNPSFYVLRTLSIEEKNSKY